jgi:hypothetical protein
MGRYTDWGDPEVISVVAAGRIRGLGLGQY